MPNTQIIKCDEHLIAEAWLKPPSGDPLPQFYRRKHHIVPSSLANISRLAVKCNYLRNADRLYIFRKKYHAAFESGLLRRCRAKRQRPSQVSLPSENVAAINLLDSWLSLPETDNSERADEIRRRIDENRLSDRKFFT